MPENCVARAAARCLKATESDAKVRLTRETAEGRRDGVLADPASAIHVSQPGVPARLALVDPRNVPRRRLSSREGMAALLHAVAHIEFNAINLAWDCVARFPGMPAAYYDDWVGVAAEEARHFELLTDRLRAYGLCYGDLPAHDGLWDMAARTAEDLAARLATVPRVLEARGLDVTPAMIERVRAAGDEASAAVLQAILDEEVGHVAIGSRWYRHVCAERGLDADAAFERYVAEYFASAPKGPFSIEHRRRAGFSEAELRFLEKGAVRD